MQFKHATASSGASVEFDPGVNGVMGSIVVKIKGIPHKLVKNGAVKVTLPTYNKSYIDYGVRTASPMIDMEKKPSEATGFGKDSYGGPIFLGTPTITT